MGHVFQTYAEAGDLGRHRTDQVTPPVSYTPEPNPYKTGELLTWRREGKYIYIYYARNLSARSDGFVPLAGKT